MKLYYNYLADVVHPKHGSGYEVTAMVEIKNNSLALFGHLDTEYHTLIVDSEDGVPRGIRTTYDSWVGAPIVFEILCSRVEKRTVKRFALYDYRVEWYHPAGCPRKNLIKPSRFDRIEVCLDDLSPLFVLSANNVSSTFRFSI
ncbi:hypothetical protein BLNAU_18133 [Blattamonas nauphoetae]|uniref:Uncharacterized protein n=1 Tax=Blattamonas nauphoetae TaxID=2049346 RepID=A0ABQ9X565_9EUKA|nr:hypothetical protein BLNAU_18133 [Blattamonas nauphoetae]